MRTTVKKKKETVTSHSQYDGHGRHTVSVALFGLLLCIALDSGSCIHQRAATESGGLLLWSV